jgi:serine/threonine protein kinase
MITGKALFPGKDSNDQLQRIFKLMGLPDEETWPSVVELPEYKKDFHFYPAQPLEVIVPGLDPIGYDLLGSMLKYNPAHRITAEKALSHPYFAEPKQTDEKSDK